MKRIVRKYSDGSVSTKWVDGEGAEETIMVNRPLGDEDEDEEVEPMLPLGFDDDETETGKDLKGQRQYAADDDNDQAVEPMLPGGISI